MTIVMNAAVEYREDGSKWISDGEKAYEVYTKEEAQRVIGCPHLAYIGVKVDSGQIKRRGVTVALDVNGRPRTYLLVDAPMVRAVAELYKEHKDAVSVRIEFKIDPDVLSRALDAIEFYIPLLEHEGIEATDDAGALKELKDAIVNGKNITERHRKQREAKARRRDVDYRGPHGQLNLEG